jgi:hypothetical protein
VYVNPATDQFWNIYYRIYGPDGDGKTKLDHLHDMLTFGVYKKQLQFYAGLMDSWYTTKRRLSTWLGGAAAACWATSGTDSYYWLT